MKMLLIALATLFSTASFAKVCDVEVSHDAVKDVFYYDLIDVDLAREIDPNVTGLLGSIENRPCWDIMEQYDGIQLTTTTEGRFVEVILRHKAAATNDCTVLVQPKDMALGDFTSIERFERIEKALFKLGYKAVRSTTRVKTDYIVRTEGSLFSKEVRCSESESRTELNFESRLRFLSANGGEIATASVPKIATTKCGASVAEYFELREATLLELYLEAIETLPVCEKAN